MGRTSTPIGWKASSNRPLNNPSDLYEKQCRASVDTALRQLGVHPRVEKVDA